MYRGRRFAQMLIAKEESDNRLLLEDRSQWYLVNQYLCRVSKFCLALTFAGYIVLAHNAFKIQLYYALASAILSLVMTKTSINGVLDRGGMFVFSTSQFREFMQIPPEWDESNKFMLDLGAGDGRVTSVIAQFYKNVAVTEASQIMEWRLGQRGYKVLPLDKWPSIPDPLHLVSALNLLDRHFDPFTLLSDLYGLTLRTNALLLIAVVLPIRQYVEFHPNRKTTNAGSSISLLIYSLNVDKTVRLKVFIFWRKIPFSKNSKINLKGGTLEEQANSLVEQVFVPAGFELIRWGKLPYLCEGDYNRAYYKLDDTVFLLRAVAKHDVSYVQQRDNMSYVDRHSRDIAEL
ncbi:unnamed protein product [Toxocara canis]|uniref:Methyltransferase-like protein 9 n=1 Tax=Toxocara canis TaxID=6265 RepID=A0A183V6E9_TOXCA|nr:unnamed protein product [Toxocara canis]